MNYVYIGAEKTSTTYLQRLFNSNKPVFADTAGITYLSSSNMAKAIVAAARRGAPGVGLPEHFRPAPDRNLLISEFFYRDLNTPDYIAGLKPILDAMMPGEYKVVLYVRDQTDWIVSFYSTYIKRGGVLPFEKYLDFVMRKKRSLDFAGFAADWEGVFGAALEVHHYKGGTVLGDVLGRFGVRAEDVPFEDPGQANVSLPVESMEILRQTNRALGRLPESEAKEELRKGLKNTVTVHANGAEKLRASPAQRARIEAFYAESNRAMNTRWGTELPVPA